jgi:hypothetical protein
MMTNDEALRINDELRKRIKFSFYQVQDMAFSV